VIHEGFGQATVDQHGRFTGVDDFICKLLGYDARTLLARGIRDVTHPEDWPSSALSLERLWTHDEPFTVTKRYLRSDGTAIWAQAYVTKLVDAEGHNSFCTLLRPVLPDILEVKQGRMDTPGKKAGLVRPQSPRSDWMRRVLH